MLSCAALIVGCSSGGEGSSAPPEGPPATNDDTGTAAGRLVYAGTSYPIVAGLAEEYRSDNHSRVDATFTDGAFFPVVVGNFTYRLASSVHAEWHAEFFSPGLDGFRDGTFDHVDDAERTASDPAARSSFFFGNAHVGIDLDGNDQVDDNENIDVVGGRIAVGANGRGGVTIELDLMLVNGERVVGGYDGAIALDE